MVTHRVADRFAHTVAVKRQHNPQVLPSSPLHQARYMKSCPFLPCVVVRRCHSYGYGAFSRLACQKNPSISFASGLMERTTRQR